MIESGVELTKVKGLQQTNLGGCEEDTSYRHVDGVPSEISGEEQMECLCRSWAELYLLELTDFEPRTVKIVKKLAMTAVQNTKSGLWLSKI